MKKTLFLCLLTGLVFLTGCQQVLTASIGSQTIQEEKDRIESGRNERFELTAIDCQISEEEVVMISLGELDLNSDAYTYENGELKILTPGAYMLSGSLDGGSIIIDVFQDEIVHLIFNGVNIRAERNPAVMVENAAKVVMTAAEGTVNIISDSTYNGAGHKACIMSNSNLTFNGTGMLNVYGYHADGIRSKDVVKVIQANLIVHAEEDGIRGNDGVVMIGSNTEIESEGNDIFSESEKDMVMISGGNCKVIAGKNAVSASQQVYIRDCTTDMYAILEVIKCNGIRNVEEDYLK